MIFLLILLNILLIKMKDYSTTLDSCKICKHPQRDEIELALKNNESLVDIINEYSNEFLQLDIPKISVHFRRHMDEVEDDEVEEMNQKVIDEYSSVEESTINLNIEIDKLFDDFKELEANTFNEKNYKVGTLVKLLTLKEKAIKLHKDLAKDNLGKTKDETTNLFGIIHGKNKNNHK